MITKEDIIKINKEIGETGYFNNESSLDFTLDIINNKKDWLYEIAYLTRSLLVDHVFRDGNKRTTFTLIVAYLEIKGINYDKERLLEMINQISKKNIIDINKIARLIKSGIIY